MKIMITLSTTITPLFKFLIKKTSKKKMKNLKISQQELKKNTKRKKKHEIRKKKM